MVGLTRLAAHSLRGSKIPPRSLALDELPVLNFVLPYIEKPVINEMIPTHITPKTREMSVTRYIYLGRGPSYVHGIQFQKSHP